MTSATPTGVNPTGVPPVSAIDEWKRYWPLVLTCFIGFSLPSVAVHATGLFIEPLQQEFGWNRGQITLGLTIAGVLTVPLSPFVGALIDRWGSRRIAVPGLLLTSLALASMSFANGSYAQWIVLWTVYGFISLMVKSTLWTAAVSSTFNAGRGVALAFVLSGTALAQIVTPPLAHILLSNFGWSHAYALLGLCWGLPAFLLALFFMVDARESARREGKTDEEATAHFPGLTPREALRSVPLIRIALCTLVLLTVSSGLLIHKVTLLTETGVDRGTAAYLASLGGIAGIFGKIVTGWLMDRLDAGLVGAGTLTLISLSLVPLLEPFRTPTTIVFSMMLMGYASGTTLQICAQLTSIYGGVKNFGKIFGVMASMIALASGLGPWLTGVVYDIENSYTPVIMGAIPLTLISAALLVRLGAYPEWHVARRPA